MAVLSVQSTTASRVLSGVTLSPGPENMRNNRLDLALLLVACAACGPSALEPIDLDLTLEATPTTVAVGQEVTFTIDVRGTQLLGLRMSYGDGPESFDYLGIAGARTARWSNTHAYEEPGTYVATARADELGDTMSRQVSITVTPVASASVELPASLPFQPIRR
jgi:hypothetical protein